MPNGTAQRGDVILTLEGVSFSLWYDSKKVKNYQVHKVIKFLQILLSSLYKLYELYRLLTHCCPVINDAI